MIRSPENPASEFVDDACVLNAYGSALLVLAHGRENKPVTIYRLGRSLVIYFPAPTSQTGITGICSAQTRQIGFYDRPVVPGKPEGLTGICSMMQPLSFAAGGADTLFTSGMLIMIFTPLALGPIRQSGTPPQYIHFCPFVIPATSWSQVGRTAT